MIHHNVHLHVRLLDNFPLLNSFVCSEAKNIFKCQRHNLIPLNHAKSCKQANDKGPLAEREERQIVP